MIRTLNSIKPSFYFSLSPKSPHDTNTSKSLRLYVSEIFLVNTLVSQLHSQGSPKIPQTQKIPDISSPWKMKQTSAHLIPDSSCTYNTNQKLNKLTGAFVQAVAKLCFEFKMSVHNKATRTYYCKNRILGFKNALFQAPKIGFIFK